MFAAVLVFPPPEGLKFLVNLIPGGDKKPRICGSFLCHGVN